MRLRAQLEHEIPFLPTDRVLRDRVEKTQEDLAEARVYFKAIFRRAPEPA